jgi:hypothetical protein
MHGRREAKGVGNMTRTTRLTLVLAVLGLLVLPVSADAGGGLPATTAHGANFLVKSHLDNNFCVQVESGSTEGRPLTMQQCSLADNQRWMLTWGANGLNEMVETQGMCVDVRARRVGDEISVAVFLCQHNRTGALTFTSSGLLEFKSGGCLAIAGAAANSAVSLAACDETKPGQVWELAH